MAYVFDPALGDEENKRREAEAATRPAAGVVTGGGDIPAGGQPAGAASASGSFTNLQRYLSENQSQSAGLAQKVAGQVTSAGEEAKTGAESFAKTAGDQIEANRVPFQAEVIDEAASNPTGVLGDEAKKSAFLKQRDATYTGPQGLEDVEGFAGVQDKVKKAQERIGLTESEQGRTQLLSDLSPGAGRGKLSLNQLLLSGTPEAGQILSSAGEPYKNLQRFLEAQSAEDRQKAIDASKEAETTRGKVAERFTGTGGVLPTMASDLTGRVATAKTNAQQRADTVRAALQGMNPTDQDLADLGLTREDFSGIKGYQDITNGAAHIDPTTYLTNRSPDTEYTMANVATADDYARQAALAELIGQPIQGGLSVADAAKAGTAPSDISDFDVPGAKAGAKANFQAFMGSPISGVQLAMNTMPEVFGTPPWSSIGGMPANLADMAGGDFYTALNGLGKLAAVMTIDTNDTRISPAYRQKYAAIQAAMAPTVNSPLFQALYTAAKTARANQAPGSPPDALINHLPPDVAAMLR